MPMLHNDLQVDSSVHNPNHVHSTLVTLIFMKFPMISEAPK